VDGIDRAGKPGLRHHGKPLGLWFGQHCIGYHHREGGVFDSCRGPASLELHRQHVGREGGRQPASAKFAVDFERRGPEPRPVTHRNAACRIDDGQRSDLDAVGS